MTSFFSALQQMLSFPFIRRAILVGLLVALCASLLGVSLVLKRYSMIGDGLSHVGFGALAVASVCNMAPLAVCIPVVVAAAFLLLRISNTSKIRGDAAVALLSTGALAVGVIAISATKGMNIDVYSYLFGSILAMSTADVVGSVILCLLVLALFILFYVRIFAVTFDETFARATGTNVQLYHSVLAVLTAVTIVIGMRLMGSMLISSLILFPALSAMRICRSFQKVIVCSAGISCVCFLVGLILSYFYALPTGASVVVVHLFCFAVCAGVGAGRNRTGK